MILYLEIKLHAEKGKSKLIMMKMFEGREEVNEQKWYTESGLRSVLGENLINESKITKTVFETTITNNDLSRI